jgi:hypothetical protein
MSEPEPNVIEARNAAGTEILKICPDGRIFWNKREVLTNNDFCSAMLELKGALMTNMPVSHDLRAEVERLTAELKERTAERDKAYDTIIKIQKNLNGAY